MLQLKFSVEDPTQAFPPLEGAGFEHVRVLVLFPLPHDAVQLEYSPHDPH